MMLLLSFCFRFSYFSIFFIFLFPIFVSFVSFFLSFLVFIMKRVTTKTNARPIDHGGHNGPERSILQLQMVHIRDLLLQTAAQIDGFS